ncbi:Ig-like domain-containing protein, partial [Mesorhizobium japonicum]|uniref:Ig-like domain-containing protein n=1 Tax=Mesorhizobium japonicum TaxID=2066070 RepID=UPI003B5B51F6
TLTISGGIGAAEPGGTIRVTFPDGSMLSVLVASDGSYGPVTSSTPQSSGQVLVVVSDAAGNMSPATLRVYTDTVAPTATAP